MLKVWGRKTHRTLKKVLWCLKSFKLLTNKLMSEALLVDFMRANYLALNPNASIPTLQDDDFCLMGSQIP